MHVFTPFIVNSIVFVNGLFFERLFAYLLSMFCHVYVSCVCLWLVYYNISVFEKLFSSFLKSCFCVNCILFSDYSYLFIVSCANCTIFFYEIVYFVIASHFLHFLLIFCSIIRFALLAYSLLHHMLWLLYSFNNDWYWINVKNESILCTINNIDMVYNGFIV